jgi:hypothetical protein
MTAPAIQALLEEEEEDNDEEFALELALDEEAADEEAADVFDMFEDGADNIID